jgi:hypothetical protein
MFARSLAAVLSLLVLAPAAQAAPRNLHAFLLRATEPEDPTRTFARTPSFAWDPVPGTVRYEFQLASSRTFADNAIVWENEHLTSPVTAIPLTLPWMTGAPYSFYARVRAHTPGENATAWSERYGFRMRAPQAPATLTPDGGVNPRAGMVRWTPVEGATAYEVTFLYDLGQGLKKKVKTATTAADLREYYTFHNDMSIPALGQVDWRVRAVRQVEGEALNKLPAVSYGPWSRTFRVQEPLLGAGPVTPAEAVSRSRSTDIVSTVGDVGSEPHELFPGFWWGGSRSLLGYGACPPDIAAIGVQCPLFHVYVYTDEDCVNRVHNSDLVGSPAYVPRLSGTLDLPDDPIALGQAVGLYLADDADEGEVYDAGGHKVLAAGLQEGIPADPDDEDLPEGVEPDRKTGIWDNDWPDSRYYWTAVPAIPRITPDEKVVYEDVEFGEDMCAAGRVITFGKTSAPAVEKSNGVPFASGMTGSGEIRGAINDRPQFFGRIVVAWKPAPGAMKYQVQWSRKAVPFNAVGSSSTASTAVLLNLPTGVWYYRVRGIDRTLPSARRGMTWSDPQYLRIVPRTFRRVG